MLEAALYTALGFAVASLLALMVAPAVWRQAVRITRNRIEASVPLTLNEIQADKDQLRAEFAMSTRRLEMNLDKLRERASTQVIEVNRKRDELSLVAKQLKERQAELDAATAEGKRLSSELKDREEKLARTSEKLEETSATLDAKAKQLADYETALKRATADVDSHKSELAARDARLIELEAARDDLAREAERTAKLEIERDALQARVADLEAFVDRRDDELDRARLVAGRESSDDAADARMAELEARNVKLEADLAQSILRATTLAENPSRENGDAALADLRGENERLTADLAEARSELQTLKGELAAAQLADQDGYENERRDNALVRERLNDLAARVTLMTAEMEGADGPVERILREAPEPPRFSADAYDTEDGARPASLADRIRALKELAEKE